MARVHLLLAAIWLLGGCSSTVRLMPTPAMFTSGDPGVFEAGVDTGQSTTIEVLYATNRLPVGLPNARHYANVRSNQLRLGVATLQVGDGTTTWDELYAMSTSVVEGERPTITLQNTREMAVLDDGAQPPGPDARAYFASIDALLTRGGNRDLLIYMHGANTDFERAAAQAAQFQHFLGRDAVVMVFAWPSAGALLRYGRDVATARRTESAFAHLLEQLSGHLPAAHLDVLAYSAGAMIASPGLARAASDLAATDDPARLRLGEVYYAAPDIDFPVFVDNLPRYQDHVAGHRLPGVRGQPAALPGPRASGHGGAQPRRPRAVARAVDPPRLAGRAAQPRRHRPRGDTLARGGVGTRRVRCAFHPARGPARTARRFPLVLVRPPVGQQ